MNKVLSSFTGSIPAFYERDLVPVLFAEYAKQMARRVAAFKPKNVLELAAGTGVVTRQTRDRMTPNSHLLASDLNEAMLDIALQKFNQGEAVDFQPINAMKLPFADHFFDLLFCQFGVMFFPDKPKSFAEAYRVLNPGGSYLFSVWDSLANNRFAQVTQQVVEQSFPNDPPGFYQVPFHYQNPDEIEGAMLAAGFCSVTIEHAPLEQQVQSLAAFAEGLVLGNPLAEELRQRNYPANKLIVRILDALQQEFGEDPATLHLSVFFVTGHR